MLKVTSAAIRAEDPDAEVVTAGLANSRSGIAPARFLRRLYRAGARDSFDTLAVHPFARDAAGAIRAVVRARASLRDNGDSGKRIWLTEFGWASEGPSSRYTHGRGGQASRLTQAVSRLVAMREKLRLRGIVYYAWRDLPANPPDNPDYWGLHTGLLDTNGRPKPALRALRRATGPLRAAARRAAAG